MPVHSIKPTVDATTKRNKSKTTEKYKRQQSVQAEKLKAEKQRLAHTKKMEALKTERVELQQELKHARKDSALSGKYASDKAAKLDAEARIKDLESKIEDLNDKMSTKDIESGIGTQSIEKDGENIDFIDVKIGGKVYTMPASQFKKLTPKKIEKIASKSPTATIAATLIAINTANNRNDIQMAEIMEDALLELLDE